MADIVPRTLEGLRKAEQTCTRCPLYKYAIHAVQSECPSPSRLMMVGEQPGNDEDLKGHPFVGPAGRMLDRAIAEAGLDRKTIFVTNAVKHFKFEPRGKRRLHKKPNAHEIERCRWWNEQERAIVKPEMIVALGATAARSLLGRVVTIAKLRAETLQLADGTRLVVTVHPSALLRTQDEADKRAAYAAFVKDLKVVARLVFKQAA